MARQCGCKKSKGEKKMENITNIGSQVSRLTSTAFGIMFLYILAAIIYQTYISIKKRDEEVNPIVYRSAFIVYVVYIVYFTFCVLSAYNFNFIKMINYNPWLILIYILVIITAIIIASKSDKGEGFRFTVVLFLTICLFLSSVLQLKYTTPNNKDAKQLILIKYEIEPNTYLENIDGENKEKLEKELEDNKVVCVYNELDSSDNKTSFIYFPNKDKTDDVYEKLKEESAFRIMDKEGKEKLYEPSFFAIQDQNKEEPEEIKKYIEEEADKTEAIMLVIPRKDGKTCYFLAKKIK